MEKALHEEREPFLLHRKGELIGWGSNDVKNLIDAANAAVLNEETKSRKPGFTESLRFEVEPLGIRVKLIEPGAIKTDFYNRSRDTTIEQSPEDYRAKATLAFKNMDKAGAEGSSPEDVAQVIYEAASDGNLKLRYPIGKNAKSLLAIRRLAPDHFFSKLVGRAVFKGWSNS